MLHTHTHTRTHTQTLLNVVYKKLRQTTLKNTLCTLLQCILLHMARFPRLRQKLCTLTHDAIYKSQKNTLGEKYRHGTCSLFMPNSIRMPLVTSKNRCRDLPLREVAKPQSWRRNRSLITPWLCYKSWPVFMQSLVPHSLCYAKLKLFVCLATWAANK